MKKILQGYLSGTGAINIKPDGTLIVSHLYSADDSQIVDVLHKTFGGYIYETTDHQAKWRRQKRAWELRGSATRPYLELIASSPLRTNRVEKAKIALQYLKHGQSNSDLYRERLKVFSVRKRQ